MPAPRVRLCHGFAVFQNAFRFFRSTRTGAASTTRRATSALALVLYVTGCPQLADDPFEKVGPVENGSTTGGGGTRTTGGTALTGTNGSLILEGVGGAGTTSTTTDGSGGSLSAGAPGVGGGSGGSEATGSGGSEATGGTGALPEAPTTLVYATTDRRVYAAEWKGASFGAAKLWAETPTPVAFVEAKLAPNRTWGVAAYQTEGDDGCTLWVHRHVGAISEAPLEIAMGEAENCSTARGFDIAFEQKSGRAMLVYALAGGELGYRIFARDSTTSEQSTPAPSNARLINWVRAVPDLASDRIAVGYTAEGTLLNPFVVQEWDGSAFDDAGVLSDGGTILNAQSFDLAYYQDTLMALRGDAVDDGFGYHERQTDGAWSEEDFRGDALMGNAQGIELRTMPYGVAGVLFDATGIAASYGAVFWNEGAFIEETQLDSTLPGVAQFASPSLKTAIARLGDAAVAVYSDDYAGPRNASSTLGWAMLRADTTWETQQQALPIHFDQKSDDAVTRSVRLARYEASQAGLILAFGEDRGLFVSSLTDPDRGWTEPVLIDAKVASDASTPFALAGPFP